MSEIKLTGDMLARQGIAVSTEVTMTIPDAVNRLAVLTQQARDIITEAEKIATLYDLSFSFDLTYGAGATFSDGDWLASSHQC